MNYPQIEHSALVKRLAKTGEDILKEMTPEKAELCHMGMGLVSDAGELVDALKKYCIYNKPIDMENIIEEMGDIEWFLERTRQVLNISRDSVLRCNVAKLNKRYNTGSYSNQQAQERADKK